MIAAGQTIGSYRIVQKIGTGGMGAVYLAEHPLIGKKVALKVIHRELASNREVVQRFFQEAQAVTRIGNEHIISIHDFGNTPEGDHFYIMEYLEGQTLAQILAKETLMRVMRALHVGAQVASALGAAHAAGVIHRDLKPDNVMLTTRLGDPDFVVLLDFGLAKMFSGGPGSPSAVKTAAGVLLGTPQYMSPEACESKQSIDHRTDVYALGVLLFQMTTGMLPFDGETMGEVLVKQVTQLPPPPRGFNSQIPPSVEQIILRCLAKPPDMRFQTMQQLRDALLDPEAYLRQSPPMAPARSLAPGEMKIDAKTMMMMGGPPAAGGQRQVVGVPGGPAPQPQQRPQNNANDANNARTLISDGLLVPPRSVPAAPPDMMAPQQVKMNTMRIATPIGYSSRPPRKMWPIVLVFAILLGLGGGAFAVVYFRGNKKPAASDGAVATTGSGSAAGGSAGASVPGGSATAGSAKGSAAGAATSANGSGANAATGGNAAGSGANGSGASGSGANGANGSAANGSGATGSGGSTPGGSATTPPAPIDKGSAASNPDEPGAGMAVIVIDSTPQNAEVFGPDKKSLGLTPARVTLPISDMPIVFELRLAGYRKKTKQLVVSGNTVVQVTLDRAPSSGTNKTSGSGAKRRGDELERPD